MKKKSFKLTLFSRAGVVGEMPRRIIKLNVYYRKVYHFEQVSIPVFSDNNIQIPKYIFNKTLIE